MKDGEEERTRWDMPGWLRTQSPLALSWGESRSHSLRALLFSLWSGAAEVLQ